MIENVSRKTYKNTNPTYAKVVTRNNKKVSFKQGMKNAKAMHESTRD
jgi:hypothetical protein